MASHKFQVGEIVNLRPIVSRNVPGGAYEVTKQLPHSGREFEYRIKSASEEHERVVGESDLAILRPIEARSDFAEAALLACWEPPPIEQSRPGTKITVLMSFKRNGELFEQPRITFQSGDPSDAERMRFVYDREAASRLDVRALPQPSWQKKKNPQRRNASHRHIPKVYSIRSLYGLRFKRPSTGSS